MSAQDNLNEYQFQYDRNIKGSVTVRGPGVEQTVHTDLAGYGLRPNTIRHPADVPAPLYHGSNNEFQPGDHIEPGHPGNFVSRMKHVYATEQAESSDNYKGAAGYGRNVYEVRPTGWYGHRRDARSPEWASSDPFEVIRKIR